MPREAILPSVALAQLLRNKRKELGLTLQEISEQSITAGDFIPASTLARIEQGKSDPGVRRVHRLLRLYNVLPQFAADMVELENLAVAPLRYRDLETLHDEGIKAWERGDIATGLAHLFAVREFVPADESSRKLRQKATISFADFAMSLGKYRLAKQLVDDLLLDDPASEFLLPLFVLQADIWRALGSVPNAVAFIRQAETIVEPERVVAYEKNGMLDLIGNCGLRVDRWLPGSWSAHTGSFEQI